jgi:transposase
MSIAISLNDNELAQITKAMNSQRDSKLYKRLLAIRMKHFGHTNKQIAVLLDVSIDTITDWFRIFTKEGLKTLCELKLKSRKKSKLDKYQTEIKGLIEENIISTITQLQDMIRKIYQIEIEQSWLSRYCKKNSIALIKKQD